MDYAAGVNTGDTRAESHAQVDKKLRYMQILTVLEDNPEGLTAKEVAVAMQEKGEIPTSERNFTSPRLTELMRKGLVRVSGKKQCGYTSKTVTTFVKVD